jgi:hypothetical protein
MIAIIVTSMRRLRDLKKAKRGLDLELSFGLGLSQDQDQDQDQDQGLGLGAGVGVVLVVVSCLSLLSLLSLLSVLAPAPVAAVSSNVSHSYPVDPGTGNIPIGSLVSLDPAHAGAIELANSTNGQRLLGVVVNSSDSLLAVDVTAGKAQVAISGTADALVSTLNGDIKVGDQVGVSAFNGVGIKAVPNSHVIGLAQTVFGSTSKGAVQEQVKDKNGQSQQITVGFIPVTVAISSNVTPPKGVKLNILQQIVKSLTGRTISTARIIIALIIASLALIILIDVVHASIYGGLTSIGRNPLAKYAVFRVLVYITVSAGLTTIVAGTIIFFLLR